MSIAGYVWLTGTLVVSLVIAFGGNYESSMSSHTADSCPAALSFHGCVMPPLHGWPAMLL
ncbi:hypothetical protein KRX52_05035 [Pseudomonas sp. MAP12]|uniref:Uncharacterized protein n=1 Tax=Geopseudomonas aromaticivorans TaxID=2849492 RepID=A0ABS6MUZ1_9GAMM|nr:hypothetical protein [Pseudomonas aromaticivorans]MBV2132161.1 hypothetical protein [Pseudomonas aromaticivorans]